MARITKAEVQKRRDEEDAKNRIFWLYEFIQRAENGGHPVPNEANLGHGEPVYVVKKRELMEFLAGVIAKVAASKDIEEARSYAILARQTLDEWHVGIWHPGPHDDPASWRGERV